MKQYIDKSAVIAEIERRIKLVSDPVLSGNDLMIGEKNALFNLLSFINTLDMKEVDLEKEIELIKGDYEQVDVAWNNDFDFIAKHFFELGLKVQKGGKE